MQVARLFQMSRLAAYPTQVSHRGSTHMIQRSRRIDTATDEFAVVSTPNSEILASFQKMTNSGLRRPPEEPTRIVYQLSLLAEQLQTAHTPFVTVLLMTCSLS